MQRYNLLPLGGCAYYLLVNGDHRSLQNGITG
jgi:hypothetical protein